MSLRPECVYVVKREAAILAGVSIGWLERRVADGKLEVLPVQQVGRGGRPGHVYRLDEVLAVKQSKRR